jgi:opacity protein-like surface antigen
MTQAKAQSHLLLNSVKFLEIFAFSLLVIPCESKASTGGSWLQKPVWAAEGTSAVHYTPKAPERNSDISPFSPGSHNVGLDLGQVILMGDTAQYSDGIGSQIHYTYGASDLFGLDTSIGYSEHSGSKGPIHIDSKYSVISLLTGIRVNMTWYDKIVPYALVGLGFYKPTYKDTTNVPAGAPLSSVPELPSISSVLFGLHFGPGIDLQVSRNFFFGAALTVHDIFGTVKTYADNTPLNVGGLYTTFFLHGGVTF